MAVDRPLIDMDIVRICLINQAVTAFDDARTLDGV
jgi:hypothetical protein